MDPFDPKKPRKPKDPLEPVDPLEQRFAVGQVAPPPPVQKAPAANVATNVGAAASPPVRQQPTNFTNFSRVEAANRDISKRQAGAYAQRAEDAAAKAKSQRDDLAARFGGQVAAGSVAASNGNPELFANADKSYTGPTGLGELDGVEDAYGSTFAAQQNLDALGSEAGMSALVQQQNQFNGSGNNALSGALIGGAGRKDFDALRARFHPETDLLAAENDAATLAEKARTDSETNAKAWGSARDKAAADKAAADKAATDKTALETSERDAKVKKANDEAAFEAKWAAAQGSNTVDEINRAFGSFNSIMSPITQIAENTGNRDPVADYGRQLIAPNAGANSGGTRGQKIWWQPQHKDVYRQMDPKQWAELNSLPPQAQQGWLEQRRREVLAGVPHQKYDATRGFQSDPHKYL